MKRLTLGALTCALILSVYACGEETPINEAEVCPRADSDTHLAQGRSSPDDLAMMLHIRNRECAATGENTFQILFMREGAMSGHAPRSESGLEPHADSGDAGTDDGHDIELKSVAFTMPAMGHGTSEAPVLDETRKDHFTAYFQMPGEWKGEIQFIDHTVTGTTQTVAFTFDVK